MKNREQGISKCLLAGAFSMFDDRYSIFKIKNGQTGMARPLKREEPSPAIKTGFCNSQLQPSLTAETYHHQVAEVRRAYRLLICFGLWFNIVLSQIAC